MIMMDQYKKETSQIHAPADLIRRTKDAVRQEEQRIAREKQESFADEKIQSGGTVQPKRSYVKVYKWALPIAAAAVCLILLNVGVMRYGRGMGESQSNTSMDMASGAAEAYDMTAQADDADMSDGTTDAVQGAVGKGSSNVGAAPAAVEEAAASDEAYETGGYDNGQSAVSAASDVYNENEEEVEDSYIKSIYGNSLWMEKADVRPSFCADSDTECIAVQGIEFYVAKDRDDTWIAYVQVDGQGYIIRGELTEDDMSREIFAAKAHELLMETVESSE